VNEGRERNRQKDFTHTRGGNGVRKKRDGIAVSGRFLEKNAVVGGKELPDQRKRRGNRRKRKFIY